MSLGANSATNNFKVFYTDARAAPSYWAMLTVGLGDAGLLRDCIALF